MGRNSIKWLDPEESIYRLGGPPGVLRSQLEDSPPGSPDLFPSITVGIEATSEPFKRGVSNGAHLISCRVGGELAFGGPVSQCAMAEEAICA